MKSITPIISGLASSLFLNVGLTQVAAKLDPMAGAKSEVIRAGEGMLSSGACYPCQFPERSN